MDNHYKYLKKYLTLFINRLGVPGNHDGLIGAHGDKCYCYDDKFEEAGLTFNQGVSIYLLTHIRPWGLEVRDTANGWIAPIDWIVRNKDRFLPILSELENQ